MDRIERSELELEAQGLVAADVRDFVIERDGSCCRLCGQFCDAPNLHHIVFRSHGGLDVPSNLIVLGGVPGHRCHHDRAHGPRSRMWREIFQEIVGTPVLGLQVIRWRSGRAS